MCEHLDSKVLETRRREDNSAIYRRRECKQCGHRFITMEFITDDDAMPRAWQAKSNSPPQRKRTPPQPTAAPWYEQWKRKT